MTTLLTLTALTSAEVAASSKRKVMHQDNYEDTEDDFDDGDDDVRHAPPPARRTQSHTQTRAKSHSSPPQRSTNRPMNRPQSRQPFYDDYDDQAPRQRMQGQRQGQQQQGQRQQRRPQQPTPQRSKPTLNRSSSTRQPEQQMNHGRQQMGSSKNRSTNRPMNRSQSRAPANKKKDSGVGKAVAKGAAGFLTSLTNTAGNLGTMALSHHFDNQARQKQLEHKKEQRKKQAEKTKKEKELQEKKKEMNRTKTCQSIKRAEVDSQEHMTSLLHKSETVECPLDIESAIKEHGLEAFLAGSPFKALTVKKMGWDKKAEASGLEVRIEGGMATASEKKKQSSKKKKEDSEDVKTDKKKEKGEKSKDKKGNVCDEIIKGYTAAKLEESDLLKKFKATFFESNCADDDKNLEAVAKKLVMMFRGEQIDQFPATAPGARMAYKMLLKQDEEVSEAKDASGNVTAFKRGRSSTSGTGQQQGSSNTATKPTTPAAADKCAGLTGIARKAAGC